MRVYADNDKNMVNIVQSVASASTMISSVAIMAKEYVLSRFPKGYIKNVYIDTAETATEQIKGVSNDPSAFKIQYPSMTITPEISLDDPIQGMEKSVQMSSPNIFLKKDVNRSYRKLMIDPDGLTSIYYTGDYITTNFNFKITTNSFIQNADLAFYLKSNFQKDFFQFWNRNYVQSEIPKTFISILADLNHWDLDDEDDMASLRLYLIGSSRSEQSILKKINAATGKVCFFVNERVNPLTLFTDLDCPASIIRDAQIEGEYTITFRLQVSCWLPNAFIMVINKERLKAVGSQSRDRLLGKLKEDPETGILSATFPISLPKDTPTKYFFDDQGEKQIGSRIFKDIFTHNINDQILTLDLLSKMQPNVKRVHAYAKELNIDLSSLFNIELYTKDGKLGKDSALIDYNDLTVTIVDDIGTDICSVVYLNRILFESIERAMRLDSVFFNENYLTTIFATIAGESRKIAVKYFANDKEQHSSDPKFMLRVQTPYGLGYIPLLDETDPEHNNYKICVGRAEDGSPIVKEFELMKRGATDNE